MKFIFSILVIMMMSSAYASKKNEPGKSNGCNDEQIKIATQHCGQGHLNRCDWPEFNCAGGKNAGTWEASGRVVKKKNKIFSTPARLKKVNSRSDTQ